MGFKFIFFAILMEIDFYLLIAEAEYKTLFSENVELKLQNFHVKTLGRFEIKTCHYNVVNMIDKN
ncbi:hypothetical protein BBC0178_009650 [Bartonella apihabitans]|uniref:Uncharacterized protein n=1 Tax=Bartonella apihabitans TaxID=2750929 RepID=A0A1U9MAA2_9HYPH|nr:hypothetical protein BBC0178_009650 [Bartonella apihabitans]